MSASYETANLQRMREDRETAKNTILQLRDRIDREQREFTSDENEQWAKANKDFDRLTDQIRTAERARDLSAPLTVENGK